jgi:hypothetical protein
MPTLLFASLTQVSTKLIPHGMKLCTSTVHATRDVLPPARHRSLCRRQLASAYELYVYVSHRGSLRRRTRPGHEVSGRCSKRFEPSHRYAHTHHDIVTHLTMGVCNRFHRNHHTSACLRCDTCCVPGPGTTSFASVCPSRSVRCMRDVVHSGASDGIACERESEHTLATYASHRCRMTA